VDLYLNQETREKPVKEEEVTTKSDNSLADQFLDEVTGAVPRSQFFQMGIPPHTFHGCPGSIGNPFASTPRIAMRR